MVFKEVQKFLIENGNKEKEDFDNKIIKSSLKHYGVRTADLRKLAHELVRDDAFMHLPRKESYETEFLIGVGMALSSHSLKEKLEFFNSYFKSVDNWALVDAVAATLKTSEKEYPQVLKFIKKIYKSKNTFLSRFAYVLFLSNYVNEKHVEDLFPLISEDKDYYNLMAEAWALSVSYIRCEDKTYEFLKTLAPKGELLRLTIRKVLDSYRVSNESKQRIRLLREVK